MNMKKMIFLVLSVLTLTACAPDQKSQQNPNGNNAGRQNGNNAGQQNSNNPAKGKISAVERKAPSLQLTVKSNHVPVRASTDPKSKIVAYVNKGQTCKATEKVGNKYKVTCPNGAKGYIDQNKVNAPTTQAAKPPSQAPPQNPATNETPRVTSEQQPNQPSQAPAVAATLTANEQQMLNLVNQERSKNGVKPLQIDNTVESLSRMKAQDMIDKNYFSHQSPTYGSPFDMLKKYNVKYLYAGENIAGNADVAAAHKSLMNSPGHRKNILNGNFTHVGIGIKNGGMYGKMYVQMFIGK